MIFKFQLRFVAFTWPNFCSLGLSLLFIVFVGRNFVSDVCKLNPKTKKKTIFVNNLGSSSTTISTIAVKNKYVAFSSMVVEWSYSAIELKSNGC